MFIPIARILKCGSSLKEFPSSGTFPLDSYTIRFGILTRPVYNSLRNCETFIKFGTRGAKMSPVLITLPIATSA